MKKPFAILLLPVFLLLGGLQSVQAQTEKELLAQLEEADYQAIEALVLYPEPTRQAILEACLHPEALIKLESLQESSSKSFQELLSAYPQTTQEMIWDLTRYPDLLPLLIKEGAAAETELRNLLGEYPEEVRSRALRAQADHYWLLVEVDRLQRSADAAFSSLLLQYDPKTRDALRELVALPEVLSILTDNIRLTILVGDAYRQDPAWVWRKADSLHLEVARQNAEELEDWKASLTSDPTVQEELRTSAEAYASEYGYDDQYYDYDDAYYDEATADYVVHQHYYYYYPYWFGYPYWYDYPRWRPFPVWYEWGFYFGPGNTVVVIGFPSYHFTHWYFYHPHHHYRYPHLSARFVDHYYGHRHSGSSITTTVTVWRKDNREVITDEWLADRNHRVERLREYGQFETERERYNERNPTKQLSQRAYLDKHPKQYADLNRANQERRTTEPGRVIVPRTERPPAQPDKQREPVVRPPERERQPTVRPPDRQVDPRKDQPQDRVSPPTRKDDPPRIDREVERGKDYHRNTWEKARQEQPRVNPPTQKRPTTTTSPRSKTNPPKEKKRKD